jgi:hypothetical protein
MSEPDTIIKLPEQDPSPEAHSVSIGELVRYSEIIAKIVGLWNSVKGIAMGATVKLAMIKVHLGSMEFSWDMGETKRLK